MATVTFNPEKMDLKTLPGIPELVGTLVSQAITREEDAECFDATCAYIRRYMEEVNSEPGGAPEPLSYYSEAAVAFSAGFDAARKS